MASYRLYFMVNSHIRSANPFEADDDDAAMAIVEGLRDGQSAELWSLDRMVRKYESGSSEPSA